MICPSPRSTLCVTSTKKRRENNRRVFLEARDGHEDTRHFDTHINVEPTVKKFPVQFAAILLSFDGNYYSGIRPRCETTVNFFMFFHMTALVECLVTLRTAEWFLTSVDSFMSLKTT